MKAHSKQWDFFWCRTAESFAIIVGLHVNVIEVEIMPREYSLDDVVTEFSLNTCRLRPRPNIFAVQAALHGCQ